MRSRFVRWLLLLLVTLVTLELVLQAGALGIWLLRPKRSAPVATATDSTGQTPTVLCIGDSFTYGLGARDPANAYPESLGRALQAAGHDVRVVNAGWPGSNSQDVLARLPDALATHRPRLCYVLVGYNDFWSSAPARNVDRGFPIELRTARLFRLILHAFAGDPTPSPATTAPPPGDPATSDRGPDQAPFLGTWHQGDIWLDFRADGTIDTQGGKLLSSFRLRGDDLLVLVARGDGPREQTVVTWQLLDERLRIHGGPFPVPLELTPGLPSGDDFLLALAAEKQGDHERAAALYERAIALPARRHVAIAGRARTLAALGRHEPARALAERLERESRASGSDELRALVPEVWLDIGDVERAVLLVAKRVADGPVGEHAMLLLTHHGLALADTGPLDRLLADALAGDHLKPNQRAAVAGMRSRLHRDAPEFAATLLFELHRFEGAKVTFRRTVARSHHELRAPFTALVTERARDAAERERMLADFDAAVAAPDATQAALTGNLGSIAELCNESGVEVVLLTYPISKPRIAAVAQSAARELGIDCIDVQAAMAADRPPAEYEAMFVLDGHCNDTGYRLMGELLAPDAIRRLQR